jgi:hypothetical protein
MRSANISSGLRWERLRIMRSLLAKTGVLALSQPFYNKMEKAGWTRNEVEQAIRDVMANGVAELDHCGPTILVKFTERSD